MSGDTQIYRVKGLDYSTKDGTTFWDIVEDVISMGRFCSIILETEQELCKITEVYISISV